MALNNDGLTGKSKSAKKVKVVNLGKHGSFKITKPGALRKKAQSAGQSTSAFAHSHSKGTGETARQSRAALGLMAMHHGK
jgi:hypothetical protein